MSFIPGALYKRVSNSNGLWTEGYIYEAYSETDLRTNNGSVGEGFPSNFELHEEPKTVSRDTTKKHKNTYEFKVSSEDAISHLEIYETLTREHPVAIVKRSDGMHMVLVHDSLHDKCYYVEESLKDEFFEAMEPYWNGYQPYSSGALKRLMKVLKRLKAAPYKNKGKLTCQVELVSI